MFSELKDVFFLKVPEQYRKDFAIEVCHTNLFRVGIYLLLNIMIEIIMPIFAFAYGFSDEIRENVITYASIHTVMLLLKVSLYVYIKRISVNMEKSHEKVNNYLAVFYSLVLIVHCMLSLYDMYSAGYHSYFYCIGIIMISMLSFFAPAKLILVFAPAHILYFAVTFLLRDRFGHFPENILYTTIILMISFALSRILYFGKYRETIGKIVIQHKNTELEELNKNLEHLSYYDCLTGLYNRRKFMELLAKEWNRCMRYGFPISLLIMDIDNFKDFNDIFGHQAGDECLAQVGALLKNSARRASDLIARYGGEEFIIALPHIGREEAFAFAETIRTRIESHRLRRKDRDEEMVITISIGICSVIPNNLYNTEDLIYSADRALYKAKESKNRTTAIDIIKAEERPTLVLSDTNTN